MAEYLIQGDTLTAIANAIRAKTGDTAMMTAADMAGLIEGISTGGEYVATTGTKTWSSLTGMSSGSTVVTHNLGAKPDIFAIWVTTDDVTGGLSNRGIFDDIAGNSAVIWVYFGGDTSSFSESGNNFSYDANVVYGRGSGQMYGTYRWIAIRKA